MVAAASTMKTGAPLACGATLRTASTKRRRTALSLPSPLGRDLDPDLAVGRDPGALERRAEGCRASPARRSRDRAPAEASSCSGATSTRSDLLLSPPAAPWPARSRAPASRRACAAAGLSTPAAAPERSAAVLSIASSVSAGVGAGFDSSGFSVFCEEEAGVVDDRELLVLILRARSFRASARWRLPAARLSFSAIAGRLREIGLEDVDRVGARVGIAHQIEERRDRLDLLRAQVQRIEVEAQVPEQRQAEDRRRPG